MICNTVQAPVVGYPICAATGRSATIVAAASLPAGRNATEANIQTITGLFDSYEHAQKAVQLLDQAGIHRADISLVSHADDTNAEDVDEDVVGEDVTVGGEIGAGLGAAGGLLAGLGIVAIPGFGAVVAGGWLIATAVGALAGAGIGAATGSFVGTLTQAGVAEHDAHVIAESVRRGGAVVSARVDERHVVAATAILRHAEGADIATRRDVYHREGWQRFVETPEEPAVTPVAPPPV